MLYAIDVTKAFSSNLVIFFACTPVVLDKKLVLCVVGVGPCCINIKRGWE